MYNMYKKVIMYLYTRKTSSAQFSARWRCVRDVQKNIGGKCRRASKSNTFL